MEKNFAEDWHLKQKFRKNKNFDISSKASYLLVVYDRLILIWVGLLVKNWSLIVWNWRLCNRRLCNRRFCDRLCNRNRFNRRVTNVYNFTKIVDWSWDWRKWLICLIESFVKWVHDLFSVNIPDMMSVMCKFFNNFSLVVGWTCN